MVGAQGLQQHADAADDQFRTGGDGHSRSDGDIKGIQDIAIEIRQHKYRIGKIQIHGNDVPVLGIELQQNGFSAAGRAGVALAAFRDDAQIQQGLKIVRDGWFAEPECLRQLCTGGCAVFENGIQDQTLIGSLDIRCIQCMLHGDIPLE